MTAAELHWITSDEALSMISAKYPEGADDILFRSIVSGAVSIRAKVSRLGLDKKESAGDWVILSMYINDKNSKREQIGRNKKRSPFASVIEDAFWVWEDYIVLDDVNNQSIKVISDISIREADLHTYLARRQNWSPLTADGRPIRSELFLAMTCFVLAAERSGTLLPENYPTPNSLRDKMAEFLANSMIDERTFRLASQIIWQLFVRERGQHDWPRIMNAGAEDLEPLIGAAARNLKRGS